MKGKILRDELKTAVANIKCGDCKRVVRKGLSYRYYFRKVVIRYGRKSETVTDGGMCCLSCYRKREALERDTDEIYLMGEIDADTELLLEH